MTHFTSRKMVEKPHYQTLDGKVGLILTKCVKSDRLQRVYFTDVMSVEKLELHHMSHQFPKITRKIEPRVVKCFSSWIRLCKRAAFTLLLICSLKVKSLKTLRYALKDCFQDMEDLNEFIQKISRSSKQHHYELNALWNPKDLKNLEERYITWQFNLIIAPWWGAQFKRMVLLMKKRFYKKSGTIKPY